MADALKSNNGQQGAVLLSVEAGFGFKTASKEQNQIMQDDVAYLRSMGAEDIRINQQQVNNQMCRVGICRPDVQATLPNSNKRIYIEYDRTSSNRGAGHASRALSNDPDAIVILRTVD